ncbi:ADP-ribosyl cyclase/cyclic ADP-ribose hydrolase 1-like isoform X2 [Talpa occidentalis]|uniref:ADP-ribosyl cyclase/cyclic ADP-ribose hydrolase 1-like isoform X2 n=1 Tax=Talpa occidentalis TaxID=50954 RepID=UPI00188EB2BC|nr:ADP-ribosyl cyclase/cyclic ADP-ribose hydrolase 1-like isoform X2 [Talpa occidentalis]
MKLVYVGVSAGVISMAVLVFYFCFTCHCARNFYEKVQCRCSRYSAPWDAPLSGKEDCNKIAEAFTKAVASTDPKRIGAGDYQPLMDLVKQQNFPCDKVLFWSKAKDLADSYQGELLTLNKLLVGYIADGLMWCRDKSSSEVKFGPYQEKNGICPMGPTRVFWDVASKWFAKNACKKVPVLLNGSNKESVAYNGSSVFASVEVPNLSLAVTALHACVIHDSETRDSCSGSIQRLKSDLRRDIAFTCEHTDRKSFPACLNRGVSQCKSVLRDSGVIGLIVALLLSINLPDSGATLVGS